MSKGLIDEFAQFLKVNGKSNSTVIAYKKDLEQVHSVVATDLELATAQQLKDALDKLQAEYEFTPKTVSRKINSLRTFYRYLESNHSLKNNPAEKLSHPKYATKPPRVLSQVEYLALREVSRGNKRLHTMIELLLQTGLRIGELSRLEVGHIVKRDDSHHLHVKEYSNTPSRRVPLNPKAQQVVTSYVQELDPSSETHPLFPTRDGNPIIIRNIRSSIDRALAKAGIENACVNDLRNTFIVAQLKAGIPLDHLADVVGHSSKTTTQKYIELLKDTYIPSGQMELAVL